MSTAPPSSESQLSLTEMLRIMDVAREMREEQLTVSQQFQIDETKARIRDRLMESAKVTGDQVTPTEVDAAIEIYFRDQFIYRDPPWGLNRLLAQLYVWRVKSVVGLSLFAAAGIGIWLAFFNSSMPWSAESRAVQAQQHVEHEARTVLDQLNILKKDEVAAQAVDQIAKEFHAIEATGDLQSIRECQTRMAALLAKLNEQYEIQIVSGSTSLISRRWEKGGGVMAYYAIVEARSGGGKILTRSVMNSETGQTNSVTTWAEQIPKEVFDRLANDKRSDGILNETRYAMKTRGSLQEQVVLPGAKPLGTLTSW